MEVERSEEDHSKRHLILESETPFNVKLSAKYSRSFAYFTVNDRLPVILTKVIDYLAREKDEIIKVYGEESQEEIKEVIGLFSKLKNELQTNKPFLPIKSDGPDVHIWNKYLEDQTRTEGGPPRWYSTVWLYAECYMYRRFREAFELSKALNTFDPFRHQKEQALFNSMTSAALLGDYLISVLQRTDMREKEVKEVLKQLIMIDLWGNSCDLSISLGEVAQTKNYLQQIEELKKFILVNESDKICTALYGEYKSTANVAFVCDNAGYELFTDLCLADFLITFSLTDQVTFHLKALPWFVSDVMPYDFQWALNTLSAQSGCLQVLAEKWQGYLDSGKWSIESAHFWTLPFDFNSMQDVDPQLYSNLARAKVVIIKGDLNYRKLLRETNWRHTKSFHNAIGTFHPTNVATLRTVKCDLICGLERDQAETCATFEPHWMRTGDYGVIQFAG